MFGAFMEAQFSRLCLFEQAVEICGDAIALRRVQIGAAHDLHFQIVGARIVQAELFAGTRHQAFAGLVHVRFLRIGEFRFRPAHHQHLDLAIADGVQQSAQVAQVAVTFAAGRQIFGEVDDSIEFVVGEHFRHGVTVGHVDDFEILAAGFGPFAEGHHHLVLGERVLDPLLRHEVGVAD